MRKLPYAESFRDLIVYQKTKELAQEIFRITASFPNVEMYSLTDQIRRSSRSVGAQIAEAWAKRRFEKHFISKLTDADAEQQETQHWIDMAFDCNYLSSEQAAELRNNCEEVGRLLNGMMAKADMFCGSPGKAIRETGNEFLVDVEDSVISKQ